MIPVSHAKQVSCAVNIEIYGMSSALRRDISQWNILHDAGGYPGEDATFNPRS